MFGTKPSLVLAVAWLIAGCSGDDEAQNGSIIPRPLSGCEGEAYAPCNVETESCQAAVFSAMACLRSNPTATRPKSRTLTATEYAGEIAASLATDDAALIQAYENCLVLLGLAESGDLSTESRVAINASTVPASYNWKTKQVTFVIPDGDVPADRTESAYLLLAHEYVHSIQDQEHDLGQLNQDHAATMDASLAVTSLIEGEAEAHENSFMAASWGLDPDALDWDARYAAMKAYAAEALADYPPILAIWRSFPYEAGGVYVRNAMQSGGMPAVRVLFENPPQASLTITSGIEPIPVEAAPPVPPEGYEVLEVNTLGSELLYDALSGMTTITPTGANTLAADWRGDRTYFYRNTTTGTVAVLWRLRFATESSKSIILDGTTAEQGAAVEGDVILGWSTDPNRAAVLTTLLDNAKNGVTVPTDSTTDGTTQAGRSQRLLKLIKPY